MSPEDIIINKKTFLSAPIWGCFFSDCLVKNNFKLSQFLDIIPIEHFHSCLIFVCVLSDKLNNQMSLISTKIFICIALTFGLVASSISQTHEPNFEKVTFNQSENIGTVYSIIKDKQGFFWLGTSTG